MPLSNLRVIGTRLVHKVDFSLSLRLFSIGASWYRIRLDIGVCLASKSEYIDTMSNLVREPIYHQVSSGIELVSNLTSQS